MSASGDHDVAHKKGLMNYCQRSLNISPLCLCIYFHIKLLTHLMNICGQCLSNIK